MHSLKSPSKEDRTCKDCGVDVLEIWEYAYIIHDKLWKQANKENIRGKLCVSCLEKRLGRELVPSDFPLSIPINRMPILQSPRLRERMTNV